MKLPSKELIKEVLKLQKFIITSIKESDDIFCDNCIVIYYKHQEEGNDVASYNRINIYEFTFKVKEWACKNKYILLSGKSTNTLHNIDCKLKYGCLINLDELCVYEKLFEADTEVEAIIKAGEWVLKQL